MGFFGALGKIIQGKPVFDPAEEAAKQAGKNPDEINAPQLERQQQPQPVPQGPKTIPVVQMRRVECHDNGSRMNVFADIHNDSREEIMLDKVIVLGVSRELDTTLRPGQGRQFQVYSGDRKLGVQQNGYATVQYRKMDGDYFAAMHQIRSRQESDGYWDIVEFRLQMPIKDLPA